MNKPSKLALKRFGFACQQGAFVCRLFNKLLLQTASSSTRQTWSLRKRKLWFYVPSRWGQRAPGQNLECHSLPDIVLGFWDKFSNWTDPATLYEFSLRQIASLQGINAQADVIECCLASSPPALERILNLKAFDLNRITDANLGLSLVSLLPYPWSNQ